jgi:hypothetical protein
MNGYRRCVNNSTENSIIRLRLVLGMPRRTDRSEFQQHNQQMELALRQQLADGQGSLYGCTLSYEYLRKCGIPVARNRMFEILKRIDPIGCVERQFGIPKQPRGGYVVLGLNFVWSVDGHHKLSMYGIEI